MRVSNTRQSETSPAFRIKRANGDWRWFVVNGTPYVDYERRAAVYWRWPRYTDQKKAEELLRDSETHYRILFESSSDAVMTVAPPLWKFTHGNPATVKIFGVKNEAEFTFARTLASVSRSAAGRATLRRKGY